ncbi:MAG: cytochrome c biogenesis protein ResB, partial [Planctomycetia bacterium]
SKATIGVLTTHIGIIMLLVAGFVKNYFSTDGHVTLFEGESASHYQSYYRWEVAVLEEQADGTVAEHILNHDQVAACIGAEGRVFRSSTLPFEVRLTHFLKNSRPMPKGPMFEVKVPVADGLFLSELEPEPEAEANVAGVCVTVTGRDGSQQSGLLWGVERAPLTVRMAGKRYGLTLRHERYPMPFEVQLLDFIKEDHPRMAMAKAFESDVKVREDGSERTVKIEMNAPLRDRGLVLYQASWGPQNAGPQTPLFSTLSVVSNPADQYPSTPAS